MRDAVRKFPARPLAPDERALVAEWLAAAGDIVLAYVSDRRGDPASLHHRIVIMSGTGDEPSHLVYAPAGRNIWMVFSLGVRTRIRRYASLRAALNSVRPVLVAAEAVDILGNPSPGSAP